MAVTFTINQATLPPGSAGLARRDLLPCPPAANIFLTETTGAYATYKWEVISSPVGSTPALTNDTTQICQLTTATTGGYLVRLTVDDTLVSEDTMVLYLGIPLADSGLPIPAFNESNQDNSIAPFDGSQGWWEKMETWVKTMDASGGGGGGVVPGQGMIYVDAVNGNDITGDGTPGKPYQTLTYAMSLTVVPLPASYDDPLTPPMFDEHIQYILAPGVYDAVIVDIELPPRRVISVTGSRYEITCNILWYFQRSWWFTDPPDVNPYAFQQVTFTTDTPWLSRITGDIIRKNDENAKNVGATSTLILEDIELGGNIINGDSGNGIIPPPP